jgi:hypothetical protein
MRFLAATFLLSLFYLVGLSFWFSPIWETNDDVAMAMVAHGYGFASNGSPNLLFSNVVWGHIVRALHGLFGFQGYSVGTFGALLLSGWSYLYFFKRLDVAYTINLPIVATVLAWPILFPQFTVNAGLLTIAAVMGWCTYARTHDRLSLFAGCILALLGFLIRQLEFGLAMAVASPFLPWRLLFRDRPLQIACLLTLAAMSASYVADSNAYRSDEWRQFNSQNLARAPYTDFGIAKQLKAKPAILQSNGYSENDIDLISNWFFVDPNLFNTSTLNRMTQALGSSLGPLSVSRLSVNSGLDTFKQLSTPRLAPITLAAIILLCLFFQPTLAVSWALFLISLFGLGFAGANAHSRVIFPIIALLVIMPPTLSGPIRALRIRSLFISLVMLTITLYTAHLLFPKVAASASRIANAQNQMDLLGAQLLAIWGDALDFEATYPVELTLHRIESSPQMFALGVMTFAPFSVASFETTANRGFIERLQSSDGIRILAVDSNILLLQKYCEEHFSAQLKISESKNGAHPYLHLLRCSRQASGIGAQGSESDFR